jgi:acetate kinase
LQVNGKNVVKILVLNAGSSSQKIALYEITQPALLQPLPRPLWESIADWSHHSGSVQLKTETSQGIFEKELPAAGHTMAIEQMLQMLDRGETQALDRLSEIEAVGHRVVHGGPLYHESIAITPEVKAAIAECGRFAPLHNPVSLEGIEAIDRALSVPQFAVFDTAFHAQLPQAATVYPGPYRWLEQGIRRYGFHGISHQYCAERTAQLLDKDLANLRLISCHLGNGCSLSAIRDGHSVDTTMGFTPLDGLMMGTRSGSVDPGILIYLLRQEGYTADCLEQLLNKESGLKGLSGISADMRQIEKAVQSPEGSARAQLAIDVFIHRLRSSMGAMLASLDRLDALIFTAGIGENSAFVRDAVCQSFGFIGLKLDSQKNETHRKAHSGDTDIAAPESTVRILVIHTQEDLKIAQDCWTLVNKGL